MCEKLCTFLLDKKKISLNYNEYGKLVKAGCQII